MVLERRTSRRKVSLSSLPAWPQWHFQESKNPRVSLPPEEVALGFNGKSAIYQTIKPGLSAFCYTETPTLPLNTEICPCKPLDQWPSGKGVDVDMAPQVDLKVLSDRYEQALFGSPVAVFVKSALSRARVGVEPGALLAALKDLSRSPTQLDEFYGSQYESLATTEFKESMDSWRSANMPGKPITAVLEALLRRETQLQVAVYLELHSHDHSNEALLDQHFDRLCIWQAVDFSSRGNAVIDFCTEVIMPYFRGTAPVKSRELLARARGLPYGASAPVARKRSSLSSTDRPRKPKKRLILQPAQQLLARAQAVTQSSDNVDPLDKTKPAKRSASMGSQRSQIQPAQRASSSAAGSVPVTRTNSTSEARRSSSIFQRMVSHRDMVEVSFRRSVPVQAPEPVEPAKLVPVAKNSLAGRPRRQLLPKQKQASRQAPLSSSTLVQATPSAARTVLLDNTERIPLSFDQGDDDGIDSTDSD